MLQCSKIIWPVMLKKKNSRFAQHIIPSLHKTSIHLYQIILLLLLECIMVLPHVLSFNDCSIRVY